MQTAVRLSYQERAKLSVNPACRKLFNIIATKQSNLGLSADVVNKQALLQLADTIGPYICMLKTHIDIIQDFDIDLTQQLRRLADKHHFLIFEDRKFADIGNTFVHQFQGFFQMNRWADIINAHIIAGPGIIHSLQTISPTTGLLLVAQMSSKDSLATGQYTQTCIDYAERYPQGVMGFICQQQLLTNPGFVHCTPGVHLASHKDQSDQQYHTPQTAILDHHTDVIIVGRGIYQATDPITAAKTYQQQGWDCYQRLNTLNS